MPTPRWAEDVAQAYLLFEGEQHGFRRAENGRCPGSHCRRERVAPPAWCGVVAIALPAMDGTGVAEHPSPLTRRAVNTRPVPITRPR
jgi:hypothetical protein